MNCSCREHPAIQSRWVRIIYGNNLHGTLEFLRRSAPLVAGASGSRLFDNRVGFALGGGGKLLGEQEV
jgi:hypothetical protein